MCLCGRAGLDHFYRPKNIADPSLRTVSNVLMGHQVQGGFLFTSFLECGGLHSEMVVREKMANLKNYPPQ